jgi:hypothetical protein
VCLARRVLNITKATDILDHIYSLPPAEQERAMESIRAIEREAMASQKPQPGLVETMTYLTARNIRKAICTRNFELALPSHSHSTHCPSSKSFLLTSYSLPVNHLLTKFVPNHIFHPIM